MDDNTKQHLVALGLDAIARWLEGPAPPCPETAQVLWQSVIPAVLDLEVAKLHSQSRKLLRLAMTMSGMPDGEVDRREKEDSIPETCALCPSVRPIYSYGEYKLCCFFDDVVVGEPLAVIDHVTAFHQPAKMSKDALLDQVVDQPPPAWCPFRSHVLL